MKRKYFIWSSELTKKGHLTDDDFGAAYKYGMIPRETVGSIRQWHVIVYMHI